MVSNTVRNHFRLFILVVILLIIGVTVTPAFAFQEKVWKGDLYPKDFQKFKEGRYSQIIGDVFIYNSDLRDLTALSLLQSVEGSLYIGYKEANYSLKTNSHRNFSLKEKVGIDAGNEYLETLKGLEKLAKVSGKLAIRRNSALGDLKALKRLSEIGALDISYNPLLQNLQGINRLRKVHNGLQLLCNEGLVTIEALAGLVDLKTYVNITKNPLLQSLEGLESVVFIGESLKIRKNNALIDLKGLKNLRTVTGIVQISENPNLETLQGINELKSIGELDISANKKLENLNGLESVIEVKEGITIRKNEKLKSVYGFPQLENIGKNVEISDNSGLREISGFQNLVEVESLHIHHLDSLVRISGFENLTSIKKNLSVSANKTLQTLTGFGSLKKVKNMYIENNPKLQHFEGLSTVSEVEEITIYNNRDLASLKGLTNVTLAKEISIRTNPNLTTLQGLENLQKIQVKLRIHDNKGLLDFDPLSTALLTTIKRSNLSISGNRYKPNLEKLQRSALLRKKLSPEDLVEKSKMDLCLMRNEIYARKGYDFKNKQLKKYFEPFPWYWKKPTVQQDFTEIEKSNISLLKDKEQEILQKVEKVVAILKRRYKDQVDFLTEYKYLSEIVKNFIRDINMSQIQKNIALEYKEHKIMPLDNRSEGTSCESIISIYFNSDVSGFTMMITKCEQDVDGEIWEYGRYYKFKINDDYSIKFIESMDIT